jgi:uncharacterized protein YndB with AHSA1/START domain
VSLFLFLASLAALIYTLSSYKRIWLTENVLTIGYLFKKDELVQLKDIIAWKEIRYTIRGSLRRSLILFFSEGRHLVFSNAYSEKEFSKLANVLLTDFNHLDKSPARRIIIRHPLELPIPRIFKAWTDTKLLSAWWSPDESVATLLEYEFKTQGNWKFTLHSIGGKRLHHHVFTKVQPFRSVSWMDTNYPHIKHKFSLKAKDPIRTVIRYEVVFASIDECEQQARVYAKEIHDLLHRLEIELKRIPS